MKKFTRRDFLQSTGGMLALSSFRIWEPGKKKPLRLSFSTLGCPDWSLDQITDFAVKNHYQGVEIRGIERVLDLSKSPHFDTPARIAETKEHFKKNNLKIVGLGSSAELHFREGAERNKNLDEAKKYIDIANEAGCPYVRVFPNELPKDQDKQETLGLISDGLKILAEHAKGTNVTILLETHKDLIRSEDILQVMKSVPEEHTGLVWDIVNMWSMVPEDPASVYHKLKKYIRHTHIKDMKKEDGKIHYVLMGEGEAPIFKAIDILRKNGYEGYFSFEWEKYWHPEIDAPEIAIAQYSKVMAEHFSRYK